MLTTVYISGATGGLGRMMAVECASRGWNLFLTDMNRETLAEFAQRISHSYNVIVQYAACDMANADSRAELVDRILRQKISFSMIINVAGVDHEGLFLEKSRSQILTILNVNVLSTIDMIHMLFPFRDRTKTFRILNICSLAGMFPMPVKATYAASKRFLIDMTLALREEFKPLNVTVTGLCPAGMMTNENCIKGAEAQGFMGRVTTVDICTIARKTIDHTLRGKALYIPGFVNRAMLFVSKLLPNRLIAYMIGRRWSKTNLVVEALVAAGKEQMQSI